MHKMKSQQLLLLLWAGLTACSDNTDSSGSGTSSTTGVPDSFVGSWINDVPARTPPDPEPDHYDRTEYVIQKSGGGATLTKYTAALDIKTRKVLFRETFSEPKPCTYLPERKCLACGANQQPVRDSLFIREGKLINQSPLASNRTAAGRGPLVLTRKPDNKP